MDFLNRPENDYCHLFLTFSFFLPPLSFLALSFRFVFSFFFLLETIRHLSFTLYYSYKPRVSIRGRACLVIASPVDRTFVDLGTEATAAHNTFGMLTDFHRHPNYFFLISFLFHLLKQIFL